MRATPSLRRRGVGSSLDSTRVLAAHGEGESPDGRGLRGRERRRGRVGRELGRGGGTGPAVGLLGRGERRKREKEKGEMGRLGSKGEGKKKGFFIFERIQTHSIQIRIQKLNSN